MAGLVTFVCVGGRGGAASMDATRQGARPRHRRRFRGLGVSGVNVGPGLAGCKRCHQACGGAGVGQPRVASGGSVGDCRALTTQAFTLPAIRCLLSAHCAALCQLRAARGHFYLRSINHHRRSPPTLRKDSTHATGSDAGQQADMETESGNAFWRFLGEVKAGRGALGCCIPRPPSSLCPRARQRRSSPS